MEQKNYLSDLLISLGIFPNKHGFSYIHFAIEESCKQHTTMKEICNKIALKTGANIYTVDSSIRNAIHVAFNSGKLKRLNEKMGIDVIEEECPTNSEFIALASQYLKSLQIST